MLVREVDGPEARSRAHVKDPADLGVVLARRRDAELSIQREKAQLVHEVWLFD